MLVKPQTETTLEHKKSKNITRYFFKLLLLTVNPKKITYKKFIKTNLARGYQIEHHHRSFYKPTRNHRLISTLERPYHR